MESRFMKIVGIISLGAGLLLVLTAFFMTPGFVASHFSPDGTLEAATILRVQLLRLLAGCTGALVGVFGALVFTYPSWVNRLVSRLSDFVSRFRERFRTRRHSRGSMLSGFVSRLGERFQTRGFGLAFCLGCFLIALMLGLLITKSGPGLSPDSTEYMCIAESLCNGNGFYYPLGDSPYTDGAPLYPVSIAALLYLGFDGEQAARLVPVLCFALLMFPLFFLGKTIDRVSTACVACLACLVFTPLLSVTSYAWTEMPYIFFSAVALLFLAKFAQSSEADSKILCGSAFFAALAVLTRYIGVTLVLVGLIVIVIKNQSHLRKMVCQTLLFGSISCLPIIPWLYRNYTVASGLGLQFSVGSETPARLVDNVNIAIVRGVDSFSVGPLSQWLLSYLGHVGLAIMIVTCFVLLAVYMRARCADKNVLREYLAKNYVIISYIFVYLIAIITLKSMLTSPSPVDVRRLCPVYPFLILATISFFFYACRQIGGARLKPALFSIVTIFCVFFLIVQAHNSLAFCQIAKHGQGYNSPWWRDSQAIAWVASNVPDNAMVYSDRADAVGFRLKRPTRYLPPSGDQKEIDGFFEELRSEENSFIMCFKERRRASMLSNSEITETNQEYDVLSVVADFPDATIWRVDVRNH